MAISLRPSSRPFGSFILGSRRAALAMLIALGACTPFPDFEAVAPLNDAPSPELMPMEDLLAQMPAPRATNSATNLDARAARLKARAAQLRGPVHDPATRARLSGS